MDPFEYLRNNGKLLFGKKVLCAIWYDSRNWGDALNPVLIKKLSGIDPILITKHSLNLWNYPIYIVIGSLLDMSLLKNSHILKNLIVWGTGFIRDSGRLYGLPRKICSVRGPLTRQIILNQGIDCPEIYGDPALLYPHFYKPDTTTRYRLGIVPHYVDKNYSLLEKFRDHSEVIIIDIEAPINTVIDQICSCKNIASSSLHGIIVADTYGVPSTWIKISDEIAGNDFKFRDYFSSVNRENESPLLLRDNIGIEDILDRFTNYKIEIDLNALLDACPFLNSQT